MSTVAHDGWAILELMGHRERYSLRPVAEEIAHDRIRRYGDPRPVRPVEYRIEHQASAAPVDESTDDEDEPF